MITKMKKFTFLIFHKEYEDFLFQLRELGAVHVEEKQEGQAINPELQESMKTYSSINSAIAYLQKFTDKKFDGSTQPASIERGIELAKEVEELKQKSEKLTQLLQSIQKEIDIMEPWGEFSWAALKDLENAGYKLRFFISTTRDFNQEWIDLYNAVVVKQTGSHYYFVVISKDGKYVDIPVERARLSSHSLSDLKEQYQSIEKELDVLKNKLTTLSNTEAKSLELAKDEIFSEIEFSRIVLGGDKCAGDKLVLLQGWIPIDKEAALIDFLEKEHHFYQEEVVAMTDDVPILLNNNSFSKLYEPITRMFALPNYSELDPTPLFAPFFMLFFGLCMGDGGYGLIIFLACWFLKKKVPESAKSFCTLGEIFGLATIVVGILTGSFFGIALDSVEWPWLKGVKDYFITEKNYAHLLGGYSPLMVFAIVIGLVQILFGMCVNAVKITKQFGIKYALSKIAWVVLLVTIAVAFGIPALGVGFPAVVTYLLYAIIAVCILFIMFYNSPDKNIFSNFGSGLWDTYNMATGLLGDTLSYIRLFALGLTGGILGGVFNSLAFDLTETLSPIPRFIAAFLILIFGHSINFGLCLISSLVHPMRLTFVEFYKNAGFEGGGRTYKPFKK